MLTKLNLTGHFLYRDASKHTNRTALKLLANKTQLKGYPEEMTTNTTPATGYKTNVQTSLLLLIFFTLVLNGCLDKEQDRFFLRQQRAAKLLHSCECRAQYVMSTLKSA